MYYDSNGNVTAAGAEADGAAVLALAEDEGWIKTELCVLAPDLLPYAGVLTPAI